jgi:hypothetical protein
LREMLAKHDNLYIDLSWLIFENYVLDPGSAGQVRPCWLTLISVFSDRFMIGSDNIGHFATYNQNITKYYKLLDALSPEKAGKVALTNFLSLLPG